MVKSNRQGKSYKKNAQQLKQEIAELQRKLQKKKDELKKQNEQNKKNIKIERGTLEVFNKEEGRWYDGSEDDSTDDLGYRKAIQTYFVPNMSDKEYNYQAFMIEKNYKRVRSKLLEDGTFFAYGKLIYFDKKYGEIIVDTGGENGSTCFLGDGIVDLNDATKELYDFDDFICCWHRVCVAASIWSQTTKKEKEEFKRQLLEYNTKNIYIITGSRSVVLH